MQMTGYVIVKEKKILVLARQMKEYISFKMRKSGQDGHHFLIEEPYISDSSLERLLRGEVIKL